MNQAYICSGWNTVRRRNLIFLEQINSWYNHSMMSEACMAQSKDECYDQNYTNPPKLNSYETLTSHQKTGVEKRSQLNSPTCLPIQPTQTYKAITHDIMSHYIQDSKIAIVGGYKKFKSQ